MASSRKYLEFILEQLSGLEEISVKAMMGEYLQVLIGAMYDELLMPKKKK